jgi:hypothetical protein
MQQEEYRTYISYTSLHHKNIILLAIIELQSIGIGVDKYCIILYIKSFIYKIIIYIF